MFLPSLVIVILFLLVFPPPMLSLLLPFPLPIFYLSTSFVPILPIPLPCYLNLVEAFILIVLLVISSQVFLCASVIMGYFCAFFSVLFLLSFIAASQLHVPFLSQQSINSSPLILQELCGLYLPFYFLLVFLFLPFYLRPLIILRFHYCHFSFLLQIIF